MAKQHDEKDCERAPPAARSGRCAASERWFAAVLHSWAAPFSKSGISLSASPVARASVSLARSKREKTRDVVAFGAGNLFLRLHHFDRRGNSGVKAISRFRQGLAGIRAIAFRQLNLSRGGLDLDKSRAHILLHPAALIRQFGSPLVESRLGLLDVAFGAASLPNRNVDRTGNRRTRRGQMLDSDRARRSRHSAIPKEAAPRGPRTTRVQQPVPALRRPADPPDVEKRAVSPWLASGSAASPALSGSTRVNSRSSGRPIMRASVIFCFRKSAASELSLCCCV